MNDSEIRRLVFQQSKSAYREIAALKDEIAKRDVEIALLRQLVEAHSIDLATKEYSPSIEAVRAMIANNVDDVARSLERNGLYLLLSRMSKVEKERLDGLGVVVESVTQAGEQRRKR